MFDGHSSGFKTHSKAEQAKLVSTGREHAPSKDCVTECRGNDQGSWWEPVVVRSAADRGREASEEGADLDAAPFLERELIGKDH